MYISHTQKHHLITIIHRLSPALIQSAPSLRHSMAGAEKVGQMTEVETHGTGSAGSTDFHRILRLSH